MPLAVSSSGHNLREAITSGQPSLTQLLSQTIKNNFGDYFGSDWPQRFVVAGSHYGLIAEAVTDRWTAELDGSGLRLIDLQKFMAVLSHITKEVSH